ncbi:hypothetical protein ED733_002009 [Metarhizium rileyi]|uniref:BTB domain-containing protein n=1 Tax=Metarhizium rileyi (strain RCEF 4871) TaxID=1649241 RepID=A0A5C6G8W0_METRR|nr:hypothetical protein ED733_002009 [Metarhizium rileyi]
MAKKKKSCRARQASSSLGKTPDSTTISNTDIKFPGNLRNSIASVALASQPIKFIVGPDRTEFTLHSHLVAQQSPILEVLVSSGTGVVQKTIDWEHVDESAFLCFSQHIYTGQYDPLKLETKFHWRTAEDEWKNRVLCHIKIYIFASCYGVEALMDSSFARLKSDLGGAKTNKAAIAAFPGILRFCCCCSIGCPAQVMDLVKKSAASLVFDLLKLDDFRTLVTDYPDLAIDVLFRMVE